jgi:hypothetical protein
VAYKAAHGDCNVPRSWAEDPRLGRWIKDQRKGKKNIDRGEAGRGMTAERAAKLDALGFCWGVAAASWEAQLAKLEAYKQKHGDCNVPKQWIEDPRLGQWVTTQRTRKKGLEKGREGMAAARVAKLDALGFVWELSTAALSKQNSKASRDDVSAGRGSDEAAWEAQLARLAAYKAAHGDCKVLWGWTEDPRLGVWVGNQRARKRKLDRGEAGEGMPAERAAKLTALGFCWEASNVDDTKWEAQLARLAAYKTAHGDCKVPRRWAEDPRLGRWVTDQRQHKRKLDRGEPSHGMTAERAAKLTALGFCWEASNSRGPDKAAWEAQLARLAAYKAAHGDCKVLWGWTEDPRLGRWIQTQRKCKKKLDRGEPSHGMTAERVAKLTALGFCWEASNVDDAK